MPSLPPRAPLTRLFRLTWPVYAYAVFEEFILLYPLYALLFHDTGLSVAQISSLFVIWALSGVVVAVPAGAWADVVPRRRLLAAAPLLAATAFALWLLLPSYGAFAIGFALWGAGGALSSGAFEALVHDELTRRGAADRYARVMGTARALGVAAVGTATLLAVPVMAVGGYAAIGTASVAACVLCGAAGLALPEHRAPDTRADAPRTVAARYSAVLREGLSEAASSPAVRRAIALVVVITALWGVLEEYVPLLADEAGVPARTVPVVVLVVWVLVTLGGLLAGAADRLPPSGLALLTALAAGAVAVGALLGSPVGWVLLGLGFGACQMLAVVADARLQARITGSARATVTSLAGLGTDALTVAAYALYAGVYALVGHAVAFAVLAVPYLAVAWALASLRAPATGPGPLHQDAGTE
ncbi:putative MFS family arabinose efflux permease [Nocardiopsis sp. Huas11]|uniref:MFS transporter n=1 Tax=Nocardiopsis sp. Huas11 TaxID=2183912 RepID=UPI000EB5BB77|nr:MFS transporter [Nocardiopsis sp. Huas11]RKS08811.1 putative MFS family arabinose efflux permease [Nocardiopsis sp. Huas11]